MIGLASRGKSFGGLAGYLLAGSDRKTPERVDWVATRNLASEDPDVAPHIMKATAAQSKRVQKPVYHLIISWDEKDAPEPEQMADVMDKSLERLGLHEHQALYVAHNDTDHRHLHAMINRVHEDTGKAWEGKHDRHVLRDVLVEQEIQYGWEQTPKRSRGKERTETKQELAIATREQRAPGRHMGKESVKKMRENLRHSFETSVDWTDLDERLNRRGLDLKTSGNGIRIFDGGAYAKLSEVLPPKMNAKKLHNRLGDFAKFREKRERQRIGRGLTRKRSRRRERERELDD
ncbi:relaxase/mobilization nuclease domain-containing protein [Hyphomonas sp.]|uniref:relaxase/mobilization nuclease domain-containing protein n=1 Tax=Hyphomonas sp. TaxID=87 RepID=UPI000C4BBB47|nr:relaxase/mobilization nuclease domain-containing protein [Hyphomonas sp.]MAU66702.1 hypothetical protein [Hyphomonas sp.]